MILWKDFVLDDFLGPVLLMPEEESQNTKVCREERLGSPIVMEDEGMQIQETRQEQRLARMAGLTSLDLAQTGMEAGRSNRAQSTRQRGEA